MDIFQEERRRGGGGILVAAMCENKASNAENLNFGIKLYFLNFGIKLYFYLVG